MKKILIRTISGAIYIAVIIVAVYIGDWACDYTLGEFVFGGLFLLFTIIGTNEVVKNLAVKGIHCNKAAVYTVAILAYLIIFIWEQPALAEDEDWSLALLTTVPAVVMTPFILQLWRNDEAPFANIGYSLLPTIWVAIPLSLANHINDTDNNLMMMVFVLIWVNDTFAYLTGMMFGRHKMWERHSPNKTWEGTIGGLLFCVATAIVTGSFFFDFFDNYYCIFDWVVIGVICSVAGTLGDLVESNAFAE